MTRKPKFSELRPGPGFRVKESIVRPADKLIKEFREYDTPDISDLTNRLYAMDPSIKNLINRERIMGPACTVKVFPGDNLMVHKALDISLPGDVIVVDAGATSLNGIIGDLIATKAKYRGIAGFVIDGLIRDVPGIEGVDMPVYARGRTPIGPLQRGPGEINFVVSCGGVAVNPGDIICADANGVVVVRKEFAERLLLELAIQKEEQRGYTENVRKGVFSNEWVDRILKSNNCPFVD
jgi:RraA family protein